MKIVFFVYGLTDVIMVGDCTNTCLFSSEVYIKCIFDLAPFLSGLNGSLGHNMFVVLQLLMIFDKNMLHIFSMMLLHVLFQLVACIQWAG